MKLKWKDEGNYPILLWNALLLIKGQSFSYYSKAFAFLEWFDLLSVKYLCNQFDWIYQDSCSNWRKNGSISHTSKACIRHSLFRLFIFNAENQLLEKLIVSLIYQAQFNSLKQFQFHGQFANELWETAQILTPLRVNLETKWFWAGDFESIHVTMTQSIDWESQYSKITTLKLRWWWWRLRFN